MKANRTKIAKDLLDQHPDWVSTDPKDEGKEVPIAKEHHREHFGAIGSSLKEVWRELSEEEKKEYQDLAKEYNVAADQHNEGLTKPVRKSRKTTPATSAPTPATPGKVTEKKSRKGMKTGYIVWKGRTDKSVDPVWGDLSEERKEYYKALAKEHNETLAASTEDLEVEIPPVVEKPKRGRPPKPKPAVEEAKSRKVSAKSVEVAKEVKPVEVVEAEPEPEPVEEAEASEESSEEQPVAPVRRGRK